MNKKELAEWKSKVSMSPPKWVLYSNLWDLVGEILQVGEITDELFGRICRVLVKKVKSECFVEKNLIYGGGVAEIYTDDIGERL